MFDLIQLDAALAHTIFAGKLHFSAITGSTNSDAMEAARNGAPHGSVYFADAQRVGRGRGDHRWESASGEGLYVSVVLRPQIAAVQLALLPLAAGLAAADAVRTVTGLTVDLRWPNDLLLGEQKTGGILVESKLEAARVGFAVVGIGINVHQRAFSPDLASAATSLDLATGGAVSRQTLLRTLLESLEREALGLTETGAIPQRVEQASSWVRNRQVTVHGPQACAGTTMGLDENGFLLVRTSTGTVTVQTGGIRAAKTNDSTRTGMND